MIEELGEEPKPNSLSLSLSLLGLGSYCAQV